MNTSRRKTRLLTAALRDSNGDLLQYLQRRVGPDEAPDLLGETLVIAWRRVADLPDDTTQARMWLFGLARGTLQNHARGERRRWALVDKLRSQMTSGNVDAADSGSEIRDAISRLAPEQAEIVQLVHWDGFTLAQAAEIIGVPATTARSRYARAKHALRVALGVPA